MKTITLNAVGIKFILTVLMALTCYFGYSQRGGYYTLKNGDFLNMSVWGYDSEITPCDCVPDNDGLCIIDIPPNKVVHIRHDISTYCGIYIGSNSYLVVEAGGKLTLFGTASMIGDGFFRIDPGAEVSIGGDVNLTGNSTVWNDGLLTIGGNLTIEGSGLLCGDGVLDVNGTITGGPPCGSMTILPITLTYFRGEVNRNNIDLYWETASELNNEYFEVEKSRNGREYFVIEKVKSKSIEGNSSSNLKYTVTDEEPFHGLQYFRLKQIDFDGNIHYSSAISINFSKRSSTFHFYPNPNKGELFIAFDNAEDKEALLTIKNALGEIVLSENIILNTSNGTNTSIIPNVIPSGTYYCNLIYDNTLYSQKIILLPK